MKGVEVKDKQRVNPRGHEVENALACSLSSDLDLPLYNTCTIPPGISFACAIPTHPALSFRIPLFREVNRQTLWHHPFLDFSYPARASIFATRNAGWVMHDTAAFFSCMSENGRRGLNLPRQGEASGKADGFFRIRAVFLDLLFLITGSLGFV
jgi:hypothetical protein